MQPTPFEQHENIAKLKSTLVGSYHEIEFVWYGGHDAIGVPLVSNASDQKMILAWNPVQSFQSADETLPLEMHTYRSIFDLDMTAARSGIVIFQAPPIISNGRSSINMAHQHYYGPPWEHTWVITHGVVMIATFTLILPLGVAFSAFEHSTAWAAHLLSLPLTICGSGFGLAAAFGKMVWIPGSLVQGHQNLGCLVTGTSLAFSTYSIWYQRKLSKSGQASLGRQYAWLGIGIIVVAWMNTAM